MGRFAIYRVPGGGDPRYIINPVSNPDWSLSSTVDYKNNDIDETNSDSKMATSLNPLLVMWLICRSGHGRIRFALDMRHAGGANGNQGGEYVWAFVSKVSWTVRGWMEYASFFGTRDASTEWKTDPSFAKRMQDCPAT